MTVNARQLDSFFRTRSLGSPENAVGFVLWRLVHRFQREIDRELASLDLTHLQFTALAMIGWLNRGERPATQAELARYADIQPMQISQILTALELKGFVSRVASSSNPRAKCVGMTRRGLAALRRAMPRAIDVQYRLFGTEGLPGGRFLADLRSLPGAQAAAPSSNAKREKRAPVRRMPRPAPGIT